METDMREELIGDERLCHYVLPLQKFCKCTKATVWPQLGPKQKVRSSLSKVCIPLMGLYFQYISCGNTRSTSFSSHFWKFTIMAIGYWRVALK